jgi:hypothetical protein
MNDQQDSQNNSTPINKNTGEVSHLLPKTTSDEIDLEIDVNRDAEITAEKPPHHS